MRTISWRISAAVLVAIGLSAPSMSAWAVPFQFTYRTTVAISTIAGIADGDEVVISVLADNGGTSSISAIWNEADLLSATLTAGSYTATYGAPLFAGLDPAFRTDALGMLDRAVFLGGVIGTNSDSFGVGGATYLFDDAFLDYFGNPAILSTPLSAARLEDWTAPAAVSTSVPEPATLVLLASGVLALAVDRRRRHVRRSAFDPG